MKRSLISNAESGSMPDSVQYTLLRTTKALRAFAPQWTALWQQDQDATPFQRPEWLLPWWHQFHGSELRAVTITKDGTLLGFLPFYLYQEPRTRERQLLPLGVGTTDYLNGVFAPDCMVSQIRRGIEMVCAEDGWDTLYASDLPLHSKLAQALESLAEPEERFASEGWSRMDRAGPNRLTHWYGCTQNDGDRTVRTVYWPIRACLPGIVRCFPCLNKTAACGCVHFASKVKSSPCSMHWSIRRRGLPARSISI